MESLEAIDRAIVLWVNGLNTPFLDEFMWIVSGKLTWIPLYVLFLYLFIQQSGLKKGVIFLLCAIAAVALTDHGNMMGAFHFVSAVGNHNKGVKARHAQAEDNGEEKKGKIIKPII